MATKIVTGADGKLRTEDCAPPKGPEELRRLRKELRDMLDGNVQFHDDPRAAPRPASEPAPAPTAYTCFCAYLGGSCDKCSAG